MRPVLLAAGLLLAIAAPAQPAAKPIKLVAIQSRLFQEHTGTLSKPIDASTVLHNVIIGEGGAAEPSSSTLVTVVVQGRPGEFDPTWRIELLVKERGGKTILSTGKSVGVLSDKGLFHAGFWLAETGCKPLDITAKVKGGAQSMTASIPFRCGE